MEAQTSTVIFKSILTLKELKWQLLVLLYIVDTFLPKGIQSSELKSLGA